MDTVRKILIDAGNLEMLPAIPAVYAILEYGYGPGDFVCRYMGESKDLRQALMNHFDPHEPNITLRYFMLSDKIKFLHFEPLNGSASKEYKAKIEGWRRRYVSAIQLYLIIDNG